MNRLFKIARRRPHIVDFYTPFTYGVDLYRIKWAANFDGAFATIISSTNVGFVDSNINPMVIESQPTTGKDVRIVFDPTTYGITDTQSFWLQFVPVTGGVEGTASAPTLILPDSANKGVGSVTIHGNAPNAASSANSLQLDFPFLMSDIRIHNEDGTNNLFVATEQNGPEQQLKADTFPQWQHLQGTQSSIWVRGGGAVVAFSAVMTVAFPR
jgi:hypothetical protein